VHKMKSDLIKKKKARQDSGSDILTH
jgi:hypothetical protein